MSSSYSNVISKLRAKSGLTQKQVADTLGLTVQTISNWENGVRTVRLTPKQALVLCEVLQCTLHDLANGSEVKE